jgi:hypothetical protein
MLMRSGSIYGFFEIHRWIRSAHHDICLNDAFVETSSLVPQVRAAFALAWAKAVCSMR